MWLCKPNSSVTCTFDLIPVASRWYVCDTLFLAYLNTDSVPQAFAHGGTSKAQTCQQNTVVVEEQFMLQLQTQK